MEKKLYKCINCGDETDILTLGSLFQGCLNCASTKGYLEKKGKKWIPYEISDGAKVINRLLVTGK